MRRLAAVLLCLIVAQAQAATIYVRQSITPRTSTGAYDAAYPDGNDGAPLAWGTCPNQQFTVGDSCAVNLRTVCSLTGTNALTATLAKVSGTLPAGCSAGTDGLTGTVSGAQASNQVIWQATDGITSVTAPFTIEAVAVPAGDTTAPTIPTGCTFTPGAGTITVECDQSSDPYVSEAGSGVAWYRIYKDGALVASKAAPSANIQQSLAAMTVGSADGTQSATQTGANRAMSGGGAGLGSTTDQLYGVGYQVTGDFIATAKVGSFAGAVTTGTAGLMARVSSAVGSIYGTCRARDSDDKVNNRYRATLDASASNTTLTAAFTFPVYLKMAVESNALTCYTSADGLTYIATATATPLSLGTQPYVLAFHASGTAATNTTSAIDQINIAPVTRWSQSVSTTGSGSWTVKAEDVDGNLSSATTAVTAAPEATACTGVSSVTLLHADDFEYSTNGQPVDRDPASNGDDGSYTNSTPRWTISDDFAAAQDNGPAVSTVHARNGTRSMRTSITFHNGSSFYATGKGEIPHRNEVSTRPSTSAADCTLNSITGNTDCPTNPTDSRVIGGHYWYGFSIWMPGDADTDTQVGETDAFGDPKLPVSNYPPAQHTFWQMKNSEDGCDNVQSNPTIQFDFGDLGADSTQPKEHLKINLQHARSTHASNCQGDPASPKAGYSSADYAGNTAPYSHQVTTLYREDWRTDRGQWIDWVIHWVPDWDNDGILQIWKTKAGVTTEVVRRQGPTMQRDAQVRGALKIGQYMGGLSSWGVSAATDPAPRKTVIYHDDLRQAVATGASGLASSTDCAYRLVSPNAND